MRRMAVLCVFCILIAALFAQTQNNKAKAPAPLKNAVANLTPLNVQTGLWQMTETVTWVGLPPQMQSAMNSGVTVNYQSCVKQADLSSNPWGQGSGHSCNWTTLTSNGTDMSIEGDNCDFGKQNGWTASVKGSIHVIDPQHGTGAMDVTVTANGQTMHGHASYTGKWAAAGCPADLN